MSGTGTMPSRAPGRLAFAVLAILAAYLVLLAILFRPAGGLEGSYLFLDAAGQEILVHRRIDPVIDFPVPQRLQAAYLFHWDRSRLGVPTLAPPYLVRWSGLLRAPQAGVYRFALEAHGEASLRLDREPEAIVAGVPAERRLNAGWHSIELSYAQPQADARLILRWQAPGGKPEVIPSDSLASDAGAQGGAAARRAAGWILLLLGPATALFVAQLARRQQGIAARLVASVRAERVRLALAGIVILAGLLRLDDYALVPFHHETADEYQHAWEGWHLLHQGQPASWTTFPDRYPAGQVETFRWFGDPYALVRPYFDHPPLFSIPIGLAASLAGAESFLDCSLQAMRLVPIALSLAGILLLRRLALAYGATERGALLAALVYAVLPVIVVSHRLVKAESLLSLLFMAAVLLAERHARSESRNAVLLGIVCGLSIWTKATGVAVVLTAVVLLLARRRHRGAAISVLVTAGFGLLYLAYAWAYDFGIFLEVMRAQSTSKWVGLASLLDLLQGKVVEQPFGRGWYLWLLLSAGVAGFRKERALLLPIVIYATVIALTADERVIFGWYRIPLYPFLCVAAGLYLEEMIEAADLSLVFPFAVTAVATGLVYAFQGLPFAAMRELTVRTLPPSTTLLTKGVVLLFLVAFLVPFVLRFVRDSLATQRLAMASTRLLVVLWLVTSVATVGRLLEIYSATRGVP